MQVRRAEEIIRSHDHIDVEFQNHPVWLEGIYEDKTFVRVRVLDTTQLIDVPLSDLIEH